VAGPTAVEPPATDDVIRVRRAVEMHAAVMRAAEHADVVIMAAAVADYAKNAHMRGLRVIIAAAGMSAALPGVVAAHTDLPVIGVPIKAKNTVGDGLDALLSVVQMPPGVPVACVAINGARNAAVLAARILGA